MARVRGGDTLLCTCLCDIYLHSRMIYRSSLLACFLLLLSVVQAVKFQLPSERHPKPSELLQFKVDMAKLMSRMVCLALNDRFEGRGLREIWR